METTLLREVENIVVPQNTKNFLLNVEVPQQTRTYKPISHKQVIDLTLESLDRCGFILEKELYTQGKGGLQANGKYHLRYGGDKDMGLMIAWQNSYDKTLSFKFAIGNCVFICGNGMCYGDMGAFKSKHQGEVQTITPITLAENICKAGDNFNQMVKDKERLKEIEVSKRVRAELIGRMYMEDEILTNTQMNIIKRQFDNPSFDYGHKGTGWELINHITFSQKEANPNTWIEKSTKTHKFFKNQFELA